MPAVGRLRYLEATPPSGVRPRGALILLHAFPLNARMWEPQLSLSREGWHVIAPQFRGFDGGDTDPPAGTMDDYAGDVVDLLDALHIEDAVVGGLSMGGYVAFALLRLAPSYVHGLILSDTRAPGDTPEGVDGRRRMLRTLAEQGVPAVADEMLPKLLGATTRAERPAVVEHVRSLALASPPVAIEGALRALMSRPDSTPLLGGIRVPTLVVVGTEDTLTPPDMAEAMHRAVSGSTLVAIDGAGHLANLERPDAFNETLTRFLAHRV